MVRTPQRSETPKLKKVRTAAQMVRIPKCENGQNPHTIVRTPTAWSETPHTVRAPKSENGQNAHTSSQNPHAHKQSKLPHKRSERPKLEYGQKRLTSSQIPPRKRLKTTHEWSGSPKAETVRTPTQMVRTPTQMVRIPTRINSQNFHTNDQKTQT